MEQFGFWILDFAIFAHVCSLAQERRLGSEDLYSELPCLKLQMSHRTGDIVLWCFSGPRQFWRSQDSHRSLCFLHVSQPTLRFITRVTKTKRCQFAKWHEISRHRNTSFTLTALFSGPGADVHWRRWCGSSCLGTLAQLGATHPARVRPSGPCVDHSP